MEKSWVQVDIAATSEGADFLTCCLSDLGIDAVSIVDAADIEKLMEGKYGAWDYIDPELMKLRDAETIITAYIPQNVKGQKTLDALYKMLAQLKASDPTQKLGKLTCAVSEFCDENWGETWKKSYNPITIGKKLLICPSWIDCTPNGRILLTINPGTAFGTGIDVTTRLCLTALEANVEEGFSVLDIGCGSGILSIAALLLGAGFAMGVDIDENAVSIAEENAKQSGVADRSVFICANPIEIAPGESGSESVGIKISGISGYRIVTNDIVCANISADVILSLMPIFPEFLKKGGLLILSGIIESRKQDIKDALLACKFSVIDSKTEDGWSCIVSRL